MSDFDFTALAAEMSALSLRDRAAIAWNERQDHCRAHVIDVAAERIEDVLGETPEDFEVELKADDGDADVLTVIDGIQLKVAVVHKRDTKEVASANVFIKTKTASWNVITKLADLGRLIDEGKVPDTSADQA